MIQKQVLISFKTLYPPWLRITAFHPETRLYTLVMVDPDVPDPTNISYKQFLHWVVPNIPLSALQSGKNIPLPENHPAPWIPPHPTNGTKYHRYVIFLFQNPDPNKPLEVPEYNMEQRKTFNLRKFISEYGFQPENGGGAHMWRELWGTAVSDIHREILSMSCAFSYSWGPDTASQKPPNHGMASHPDQTDTQRCKSEDDIYNKYILQPWREIQAF